MKSIWMNSDLHFYGVKRNADFQQLENKYSEFFFSIDPVYVVFVAKLISSYLVALKERFHGFVKEQNWAE